MQESLKKLRLYIHIPFCIRKCLYCDFVSFAGKEDFYPAYTDALCRQIRQYGKLLKEYRVTSVYIGGGTPSALPADLIRKITDTLQESFSISGVKEKRKGFHLQKKVRPATEFSMECNPGTVDRKKLKTYKKAGINRLSFGLQSSDPEDLKRLGRIHTFEDFLISFEEAREAGFDNINVDLMQAIPGQTLKSWQKVLSQTAVLKPEHLSAYSLIIEEGTPFYESREAGGLLLPDEDTEREIYYHTRSFLEKCGYQRYEISNYAVPGYECSHNTGYWKRDDYLGLGLHASSLLKDTRWRNTDDLPAYIAAFSDPKGSEQKTAGLMEAVLSGKDSFRPEEDAGVILDHQKLSHTEQMEEFMFLGLRLTEGISRNAFFQTFHQDFDFTYGEKVRELKQKGLIESSGDRVFLTDRGIDVSNMVLAEFLF